MTRKERAKTCFVISPIGEEGTEARRRSDEVLDFVIKPTVLECGYSAVVRADHISRPGMITSDIIQHLLEDDLVVADLTGHNPNVFYELAVRHAVRKAIVQIIHVQQEPPFDLSQSRTIKFDSTSLRSAEECRSRLKEQIHEAEINPSFADNPISQAIDLRSFRQSENPIAQSNAEILRLLQDVLAEMADLKDFVRGRSRRTYWLEESQQARAEVEREIAKRTEDMIQRSFITGATGSIPPENLPGATGPEKEDE